MVLVLNVNGLELMQALMNCKRSLVITITLS